MAALTPVDAALSVGQRIGRYFALTSMLPSLLLVLWIYILIATGTLSGTPQVSSAETALSHWSVGRVAGLVVASLAVALILHPLQFSTTQLLEGYWGTSALAVVAMKRRIVHHRRRQRALLVQAGTSNRAWRDACLGMLQDEIQKHGWRSDSEELSARIKAKLRSKPGDSLMGNIVAEQEALDRYHKNYPLEAERILPTRLGNALRRFEDAAGRQYGLQALAIAPHLHLVAPPRHLEYLVDVRRSMDATIRICTVGLIATCLTAAFLFTHGVWLFWALVPYAVSYLAYRGAVSAAQSYGNLVSSVIDLDRFTLYRALGLDLPRDSVEERLNNGQLMQMLAGKHANVRYHIEEDPASGSATPSGASGPRSEA